MRRSFFPRVIFVFSLALISWCASACRRGSVEPVSLSFIDPEWSHDTSARREIMEGLLQEFTKETGIRVHHLPAPEAAAEQLQLTKRMLEKGSADIYGIDVIWPGILKDQLLDLKPYLFTETANLDSEMVSNFTVQNRLIAVPFHTNVAVLYYRTDLLREYGFAAPPKTWDELEKMAVRIQAGERAKGNRDFWGYFWSAAPSEELTCEALEWQYSEGGGHIIDPGGKISVNNARAVRSWERAARWIGRISPPATLSYQEWDAINAFEYAKRGAFLRSWTSDYFLSNPVPTAIMGIEGVTAIPGGGFLRAGTLGGFGLAVSRTTTHPHEAVQLVRFLLRRENELEQARKNSHPPGQVDMVDLPAILAAYSADPPSKEKRQNGVVARPSTVTGEKYDKVSQAYFQTVFSVLNGKAKASEAASRLEKQLVEMTGLSAGTLPEAQE